MKKSLVIGLVSAAVEGRKHLVRPSGRRITNPPKVCDDETCDPVCIFEDEDKKNYWCLDFKTPHSKIGWEWVQDLNETDDSPAKEYLQWDLRWYIETYFEVISTFDTPRLYFNELKADLEEFKAYIWMRINFNEDYEWCPGIGWGNDAIDLKVEMMHKMA